jgi:murein DD-endopeptidase MepM/ murein hydrolase activator NlpD
MLGLAVTVEHKIDGKKVVSTYGHMSKLSVSKGEKIKAGEKVGEV